PLPTCLDRFEILDILGQGGFSRVFLARDPQLDRLVALKVPRPWVLADPAHRRRFEREALAAATLSHPAIIPIYETGAAGPVSYIAFGYCEGSNLADWVQLQTRRPAPREVAAVMARLAEAVEHAHRRGVVHRDLKPANILVEVDGAAGEPRSISDRLRITDFGLAKLETMPDDALTVEGAIVGTPAYMSPEQARGELTVGAASDLFSLGAILYELLTGTRAFRAETHLATLRAIETAEPTPPRAVDPQVPRDLESICLKCLRKEPGSRYRSAHALAADLERWLDGHPVTARPATRLEKTLAWARRNPGLATVSAVALLCFLLGLLGTTWQWQVAKRNLAASEHNLRRAEAATAQEKAERIRAQRVAAFLGNTYRSPDPSRDGRDLKVVELLNRAEQEINETFANDARTRLSLLQEIARSYRGLGLVEPSRDLVERTYHDAAARSVLSNTAYLKLLFDVVETRREAGDYDGATAVCDEATEVAAKFGDGSHEAASAMIRRALILQDQNDYQESVRLYREALPIIEREVARREQESGGLSRERLSLSHFKGTFAMAMVGVGAHAEALEMLEPAIAQLEATVGSGHPATLQLKEHFANALHRREQSNLPEHQVALRRQLWEESVRVLGADHPRTLQAMSNLAATMTTRGQAEAAVPIYEECIERSREVFGETSQYVAIPQYLLGNALRDLRQFASAAHEYDAAWGLLRSSVGPTNNWTTKCFYEMIRAFDAQHDHAASADRFDRYAEDLRALNGPQDPEYLKTAMLGAIKHVRAGDVERGLAEVNRLYDPVMDLVGDPSRGFHARLLNACVEQQQFAPAVRFADAYAHLLTDEATARQQLQGHALLAIVYRGVGQPDQADQHLDHMM
ncbi:MAG: protein kinase, partial [Planctomycetota bacterium]